jgi:3-methyladenine DNA glycosylase AlkD
MARTKAKDRSLVESSIVEGKKILIASTYLLPLIAMASMSGMRSWVTYSRNWLTLDSTNTTNMSKTTSSGTQYTRIL